MDGALSNGGNSPVVVRSESMPGPVRCALLATPARLRERPPLLPLCPPLARHSVGLPGLRRLQSQSQAGGFALPLALVVALLLLLSSLSVQTMMLQVRSRRAVLLELRQAEDQLVSAAHLLVGRLQERHPCLIGLALSVWTPQGQSCAAADEIQGLLQHQAHGLAWSLVDWQPQPGGSQAQLLLQLQPIDGHPPRRQAFRVELDSSGRTPRVLALRPLGLQGMPTAQL